MSIGVEESGPATAIETGPGGDARLFGAFTASGSWTLALLVARAVSPDGTPGKLSFTEFAEQSGSTVERVRLFHDAWERAAADGLVPPSAELRPGADTVLPEEDAWPHYRDEAPLTVEVPRPAAAP
ncbi:hypothetical protein, partial [Actinocorallia lasiicapitis]